MASSSAVDSGPWLKPSSTCNFSKSADSNIEISNRFESLGCEGNTEESDQQETINRTSAKKYLNKHHTNFGEKQKGGSKDNGNHLNTSTKKQLTNSQQKDQE
mgnify:FL=1